MDNDPKAMSFAERKLSAIKEIEVICKKYEVDVMPILAQVGQPNISAITLISQLSIIDLKDAPKMTVQQPTSEKFTN